jgi:hypothetical protein
MTSHRMPVMPGGWSGPGPGPGVPRPLMWAEPAGGPSGPGRRLCGIGPVGLVDSSPGTLCPSRDWEMWGLNLVP